MKYLLRILFIFPLILFSQTQIGQDIDGESFFDVSGAALSLSDDGTIVAIGAPFNDGGGDSSGHVRVYENINGIWTQIGQDIDGGYNPNQSSFGGDHLGKSVKLSSNGSIIAVRAPWNDGNGQSSGVVKVYENIGGIWIQIGQDIYGEAHGDQSGDYYELDLSSDGSIVAIGATGNDGGGNNSGHVRVFENQSGTWVQIGQDIDGEIAGEQSGRYVKLSSDGDIVAIQSWDGLTEGSEVVRFYENVSGTWTQLSLGFSGFFDSLSSDGSIISRYFNIDDTIIIRVYENIDGVWTQIGQDIEESDDNFLVGRSYLSSDGSIIAISDSKNDANGIDSGQVRIYKNILGVWTQIGVDINGEAAGDHFGQSISLNGNGDIIAIAAPENDGDNSFHSGHVRVYDLSQVLSIKNENATRFNIYPNPTKNQFTIQLNDTSILEKVTIYNTLGQVILTSEEKIVDTSKLASGSYIVEVLTTKGKASKQLIIE